MVLCGVRYALILLALCLSLQAQTDTAPLGPLTRQDTEIYWFVPYDSRHSQLSYEYRKAIIDYFMTIYARNGVKVKQWHPPLILPFNAEVFGGKSKGVVRVYPRKMPLDW